MAYQAEIARYWYERAPAGWSWITRLVAAPRALDHFRGACQDGIKQGEWISRRALAQVF